MQKKIVPIMRSSGLKSAALMTVGSIGATVLSAIAMIIFSRLLGPSDFGIFSVLFSLLLILSKVGDAGVNLAVQREIARHKNDEAHDRTLVQTGMVLKVVIMCCVALVGLCAGPWISTHWLHVENAGNLVTLIFVTAGGVVFYEYANTILQAKEHFALSVISNTIQSALKLIVALGLIYIGISLPLLTAAYIIIPVVGALITFVRVPPVYFVPRYNLVAGKTILSVAKWTSIAIVAATVADNVDVLIVQGALTSYATGLWSAAVRIATVASLVAWSLGTVLNIRVAGYHDKKHIDTYLKKAVLVSLVSLVGISLAAFLSHPAIVYTVGTEYLAAVGPLNLLLYSTAILTATAPFVALFYLFEKPAYFAISGILSTVILLCADLYLIPRYGLMGAGYARILTRLGILIFTLYYARKAYVEKYA